MLLWRDLLDVDKSVPPAKLNLLGMIGIVPDHGKLFKVA